MQSQLALAGLLVGFLIGISGVGSGSLMAPILLLFGIPPLTVVGSDLGFGLFTKSAGVGLHIRRGLVRWRWVWLMAAGSLPGTFIGSFFVARVAHSGSTVRLWIAAVLVVTSLAALLLEAARRHAAATIARLQRPHPWLMSLLGLLIGTAVGATSVGSGSLIDIALVLFSPLSGAEIVGTGVAHGILLLSTASLVHWNLGTIDPPLVFNLLLGSIPGVLVGARLACRFPSRPLRWAIVALVMASGLTTITRSVF